MLVILISFSVKYLDIKGENQFPKKQSISHIIELPEAFDLGDIWCIRNLKTKSFNFRQKHFSGTIQRRLDYLFISNSLQEKI